MSLWTCINIHGHVDKDNCNQMGYIPYAAYLSWVRYFTMYFTFYLILFLQHRQKTSLPSSLFSVRWSQRLCLIPNKESSFIILSCPFILTSFFSWCSPSSDMIQHIWWWSFLSSTRHGLHDNSYYACSVLYSPPPSPGAVPVTCR